VWDGGKAVDMLPYIVDTDSHASKGMSKGVFPLKT